MKTKTASSNSREFAKFGGFQFSHQMGRANKANSEDEIKVIVVDPALFTEDPLRREFARVLVSAVRSSAFTQSGQPEGGTPNPAAAQNVRKIDRIELNEEKCNRHSALFTTPSPQDSTTP